MLQFYRKADCPPDYCRSRPARSAISAERVGVPLGPAVLNGKKVFIIANPHEVATSSQIENRKLPTNRDSVISWNLGQFDKKVIRVLSYLLSLLSVELRRDIVQISRHLTATTNSNDDNGILVEKWTNDYKDNDTKPWEWNGSWNNLDNAGYSQVFYLLSFVL